MGDQFVTSADLEAFASKVINLPPDEAEAGRARGRFLRERLKIHIAANPGFSLVKMLHAGSVAKGTALSDVNDLDVAVYVKAEDAPESGLVDWMTERLRDAYGDTIPRDAVQPGVHCATITFASGLSVDVVPVLYEGDPEDRGYLIARDTGKPLLTSVRLHIDFIRKRKKEHPDDFAQLVRYLKWWIRLQKKRHEENGLPKFAFKSFMAELIVAHLVDGGLDPTDHVAALTEVFNYIVDTGLSERIAFDDYYTANELPGPTGAAIEIFDPVNPDNNVAFRYSDADRERIVTAADEALAACTEASFATTKGQAVTCWQIVLGTRFKG